MTLIPSRKTRTKHIFKFFSFYLITLFFQVTFPINSISSESFTGQCIDVADGDTITVQTENQEKFKIRLAGIDSPESIQAHGEKSKQYLSALVFGKRVRIQPETVDQYGRTVGMVFVNGLNINEQIVANGHAWVFRKYCTAEYCKEWLRLEEKARKARIGLWEEKNPKPPWDWRAENSNKNGSW